MACPLHRVLRPIAYDVQVVLTPWNGNGTPSEPSEGGIVALNYGSNSLVTDVDGQPLTFTSPGITGVETPIDAAYDDEFGPYDPSTPPLSFRQ